MLVSRHFSYPKLISRMGCFAIHPKKKYNHLPTLLKIFAKKNVNTSSCFLRSALLLTLVTIGMGVQEANADEASAEMSTEEKIAIICQQRFENSSNELARLRAKGILNQNNEKNIDNLIELALQDFFKSIQRISPKEKFEECKEIQTVNTLENKTAVKMTLARALEIKDIYKDSHFVFFHAQSSEFLVTTMLIQELYENRKGNFIHLRSPPDLDKMQFLDFNATVIDDDYKLSDQLLACDATFNYKAGESALYFLLFNRKATFSPSLCTLNDKVISNFIPSITLEAAAQLSDKISYFGRKVDAFLRETKDSSQGTLYVICIPKSNISNNVLYQSHSFGKKCHCSNKSDLETLEELQKDVIAIPEHLLCKNGSIPQYRLITKNLRNEEGVEIHMLTPLNDKVLVADIAMHIKRLSDEITVR